MEQNRLHSAHEMEALFMEYCRRQVSASQQTLQALQQANAALQEAQQLILTDIQFYQTLVESGDVALVKQVGTPTELPQEEGQVPPWRLSRPPNLQ